MSTSKLTLLEVINKLHGFIDIENLPVHQVYQVDEIMQLARVLIDEQEGIIENLNEANDNLEEARKLWKAEYEKLKAKQPKPEMAKCRHALIIQTYRMRSLQKAYFQHKAKSVLDESKNVEARVDRLFIELEQHTGVKFSELLKTHP